MVLFHADFADVIALPWRVVLFHADSADFIAVIEIYRETNLGFYCTRLGGGPRS